MAFAPCGANRASLLRGTGVVLPMRTLARPGQNFVVLRLAAATATTAESAHIERRRLPPLRTERAQILGKLVVDEDPGAPGMRLAFARQHGSSGCMRSKALASVSANVFVSIGIKPL